MDESERSGSRPRGRALPPGLADVAAWNFSVDLPLFLIVLGGALLFLELIVELVENLRRSDWK